MKFLKICIFLLAVSKAGFAEIHSLTAVAVHQAVVSYQFKRWCEANRETLRDWNDVKKVSDEKAMKAKEGLRSALGISTTQLAPFISVTLQFTLKDEKNFKHVFATQGGKTFLLNMDKCELETYNEKKICSEANEQGALYSGTFTYEDKSEKNPGKVSIAFSLSSGKQEGKHYPSGRYFLTTEIVKDERKYKSSEPDVVLMMPVEQDRGGGFELEAFDPHGRKISMKIDPRFIVKFHYRDQDVIDSVKLDTKPEVHCDQERANALSKRVHPGQPACGATAVPDPKIKLAITTKRLSGIDKRVYEPAMWPGAEVQYGTQWGINSECPAGKNPSLYWLSPNDDDPSKTDVFALPGTVVDGQKLQGPKDYPKKAYGLDDIHPGRQFEIVLCCSEQKNLVIKSCDQMDALQKEKPKKAECFSHPVRQAPR